MIQKRFNPLTILNLCKHKRDRVDLKSVGSDFVAKHNESYSTFGKFSQNEFV